MVWPSGARRAAATWPPRKVRRVKSGFAVGDADRPAQNAAATASSRMGMAANKGVRNRPTWAQRDIATAVEALVTEDKLSRSKARSRADWNRMLGSFSRQWRTILSSPGA